MVGDEPLSPGRLEAFSDGVIAIILTIMVLELKAPASADPKTLLHEWPIFVSYVISYFYVAVYWINHHHLFHRVKRVDVPILWANIAVLFCMSLIPFFTEWMESTRLSPFPTAIYAATMLLNGVAFSVLEPCRRTAVGRQPGAGAAGAGGAAQEPDRDRDLRGCNSDCLLPHRHLSGADLSGGAGLCGAFAVGGAVRGHSGGQGGASRGARNGGARSSP